MKTLKLLNFCLLVIAALLLVTAVAEFAIGNIHHGICNILWMGCEIFFFLVNKHSIEIKQDEARVYGFLSAMDDTIEKYGAAIITEDEDGKWEIQAGERNSTSCSAENNDQIAFGNNSNVGDKK